MASTSRGNDPSRRGAPEGWRSVRARGRRRRGRSPRLSSLSVKLAIHRAGLLRPAEKLRLEAAVDAGLGLASLGFSALERLVGRLLRGKDWDPLRLLALAEADLELLAERGIRYIPHADPEYPPLLREIHDPPYGLFARGAALEGGLPSLAMVGTRRATGRGMAAAERMAAEASAAGLPVVSGLARGIDGASHRGALAARSAAREGAPTVAVLPVGIDGVYPAAHRRLAEAILEAGGTLVSEYSPGEEARTWRFPERNRVIAGMCRGTLVVEAPAGSGALITAEHALDAGRDVFVARELLEGPMNAGADALASEGARAVASAAEILADWGLLPGAGHWKPQGGVAGEGGPALAAALRAELGLDLQFDDGAPDGARKE